MRKINTQKLTMFAFAICLITLTISCGPSRAEKEYQKALKETTDEYNKAVKQAQKDYERALNQY